MPPDDDADLLTPARDQWIAVLEQRQEPVVYLRRPIITARNEVAAWIAARALCAPGERVLDVLPMNVLPYDAYRAANAITYLLDADE